MPKHTESTISEWLRRILGHEGGFNNNPEDPGNWTGGARGVGELKGTKWGIAANTYPQLDIAALCAEDAASIYMRDYLRPLGAEKMRDGVVFQMLDFSINSGIPTAVRRLQRAVGVADDGIIGPVTIKAMRQRSESDLIMIILAERLEFMASLSTWEGFSRGWARRVAQNLRHGALDS